VLVEAIKKAIEELKGEGIVMFGLQKALDQYLEGK